MNFESKFSPGQRVVLIENNRIIYLPIHGIEIVMATSKSFTTIKYSFLKSKAVNMDEKDVVLWREEHEIFKTVADLVEPIELVIAIEKDRQEKSTRPAPTPAPGPV